MDKYFEQRDYRNKLNYEKDINEVEKLTLRELLYFTKNRRALKRHKEYQGIWEDVIIDNCIRANKKLNQSLLLKGDAFRRRNEIRNALDLTRTMNERYGFKLFYHILRKYP